MDSDKVGRPTKKEHNSDESFFRTFTPNSESNSRPAAQESAPQSDSPAPKPQSTSKKTTIADGAATEGTGNQAEAADVSRNLARNSATSGKVNETPIRRYVTPEPSRGTSLQRRRTPKPFDSRGGRDAVTVRRPRWQSPPDMPWGLSQGATDTAESKAELPFAKPDPNSGHTEVAGARETVSTSLPQNGKELSHVTSSGEAHMVDVGNKPATRRVAIAIAHVWFSNPEPFRLIFENNNKKGDVLGVARVAGIMAAKRTSDLIPLCHPIAITKLDVDVKLDAPGTSDDVNGHRAYGSVSIQALVESVGPTGAEMEALTAATVAALTAYDMCKAVDRRMKIREGYVVYKSGGKSGFYVKSPWAKQIKKEFFVERNLEPPAKLTDSGGEDREKT